VVSKDTITTLKNNAFKSKHHKEYWTSYTQQRHRHDDNAPLGLQFIASRSNQLPIHIYPSLVRDDSIKTSLSNQLNKDARLDHSCIQLVVIFLIGWSIDWLSSTTSRVSGRDACRLHLTTSRVSNRDTCRLLNQLM